MRAPILAPAARLPRAAPRRRGAGSVHAGRPGRRSRTGALARVVTLLALLAVTACGTAGDPDLEIGPARASERAAGASQVVVDVTNHGDGDDRLVAVSTPAAVDTEIHLTILDEGRATMGTVDDVEIPAGETVRFRPGGLHMMLAVPDESVVAGGTFELTLVFDRSGELTVPVQVVEQHELLEPVADTGTTADTDNAAAPDPDA